MKGLYAIYLSLLGPLFTWMLAFADGASGTVSAGWLEPSTSSSFSLVGTRGKAVVEQNRLTVTGDAAARFSWRGLEVALAAGDSLAAFLDHLTREPRPLVSPEEAFRAVAVVEAMYRSVETGRWETPPGW